MVFNTTLNNISKISWWSVVSVEENGVKHQSVASHRQTLSHNVVSSTPRHVLQVTDKSYHIMLYQVHHTMYCRSQTNFIT